MKVQWKGDNREEVDEAFNEAAAEIGIKPGEAKRAWAVYRDLGTRWPKLVVNWLVPGDPDAAPLGVDVPLGWWVSYTPTSPSGIAIMGTEPEGR